VADVVKAEMSWEYTTELIQGKNRLNVQFAANDLKHQVILFRTAEFTVERNHINVICVRRRSERLDI